MPGIAPKVRDYRPAAGSVRIGLFGLLGSGNLGNDASLAAILGHIRAAHPSAVVSVFCSGPEEVASRFDVRATRLNWYHAEYRTASRLSAILGKALGKLIDVFRTATWVRRQDMVIVPGMGVLESTLPVRPWGFPFSLLLLALSGRVAGTRVAMPSIGANVISNRMTRTVVLRAARLATYRSYRDSISRDALRAMGLDTANDNVYTDLVFGSPVASAASSLPDARGIVGVGVMDYGGGDDDRADDAAIRDHYLEGMTTFIRHLVADGRRVRLLIGDQADSAVAAHIANEIASPSVETVDMATPDDLTRAMADVDVVVATRYHNVITALKLCKPTISIGYAEKNDVLMAAMGLEEYCQQARDIDGARLVDQLARLESHHDELRAVLATRVAEAMRLAERQFAELSEIIRLASSRGSREQQQLRTATTEDV